ncbi:MAG TPA: NAD(P)/FAD-dependent oxidoreductase [Desulfomonilia bacterium]
MSDYNVIVIGAGCGGLSAGAQLAKNGRKVLVLEQTERIGGCCSTYEQEGFRFDIGASIVEAPDLLNRAFGRLGTTLEKEVDLIECDPIYTVILQDGSRITIPKSMAGTEDAIRAHEPDDVEGWRKYSTLMDNFRNTLNDFFTSPVLTLSDMGKIIKDSPAMLKYGSLFISSYQDVLNKYFKNEKVKESMAYQTFFIGLPPELAPGIFAVIPFQEHDGLYYVRGGMIGIPEALRRCGEKEGMEVRLKTKVKKVIIRNKRAVGVKLEDGTEISADVVVSDINAKTLYLEMIGEDQLPWLARIGIKSYETAIAVPMLYLGVNYTPPLNSHHTLVTVPMEEMNDFWWTDYRTGGFTRRQFAIVSWTSQSDPKLAPKGKHVLILTLPPSLRTCGNRSWDEAKPEMIEKYIDYYSKRAIPGLKEHVDVAELATPLDFERRLGTPDGAIYALRQDMLNETVLRPAAKSKSLEGLYLVGASTHPGGGVPTTIASGIIATDLIEKYEKK